MEWSLDQSTVAVNSKSRTVAVLRGSAGAKSSFHPDFAVETDDAALRRLLREASMPGSIQISLEREPSYFDAANSEGGRYYTFCARDSVTGEVFAMGCRTVRELYVNGQPHLVGYLSQLRIAPRYRHLGRSLLRQGFALLNNARAKDETFFDITTIVASNQNAKRLLECGLPYLPRYTPVEQILTFMLPTRDWRDVLPLKTSRGESPETRMEGPLQFAPVLPLPEPIWDQRAFKQIVIRGYSTWLRRCRWLLRMPLVGAVLPAVYLTGSPPDFSRLDTMRRMARAMGGQWLALALAARNPWVHWLRRHYRPRIYESTLYVVHPPDMPVKLDGRSVHVEAALL
jgi:hypothetical protein